MLRPPLCAICKDQVHDFVWLSLIQSGLVMAGVMGGLLFVVYELLLFVVLVVVETCTAFPR